MSGKLFRWCLPLSAAALVLSAASPAAAVTLDPGPVGAGQFFLGAVNGQTGQAVIAVTCDGVTGPTATGHPVEGQTVAVHQRPLSVPPDPQDGFTGSTGKAITVSLGAPTSVTPANVLRFYEAAGQIPTSLAVPCTGGGIVTFVPSPTSPTARAATVRVTFVSQILDE